MKAQTKWLQMLKGSMMVLMTLALVACGDSEAFVACGDGEMPERPTSGRQLPVDSKSDAPAADDDDTTREVDEESGDDLRLSWPAPGRRTRAERRLQKAGLRVDRVARPPFAHGRES